MQIDSLRRLSQAMLAMMGLVSLNMAGAAEDGARNFQVSDGVAIYLGVMPAQIIRGHAAQHPEARMHGGVPSGGDSRHVVVALFESASGLRIEHAQVTATVMTIGRDGVEKDLEPMRVADSVTYGNYFDMPADVTYRIKVRIRRPGVAGVVEAAFTRRQFGE